jgi:hypothetical protein
LKYPPDIRHSAFAKWLVSQPDEMVALRHLWECLSTGESNNAAWQLWECVHGGRSFPPDQMPNALRMMLDACRLAQLKEESRDDA